MSKLPVNLAPDLARERDRPAFSDATTWMM
jgi:hypothetical protein